MQERLRADAALPHRGFLAAQGQVKTAVLVRPAVVGEEQEDLNMCKSVRFVAPEDMSER